MSNILHNAETGKLNLCSLGNLPIYTGCEQPYTEAEIQKFREDKKQAVLRVTADLDKAIKVVKLMSKRRKPKRTPATLRFAMKVLRAGMKVRMLFTELQMIQSQPIPKYKLGS